MPISRRNFLARAGQAGGFSAAFLLMQSLGLIEAAELRPLDVAPGIGKGVSVAILGGGIAGLVAAYEMRELGYACTILEARSRSGGRNWTVRGGDTVEFIDGSRQLCSWDAGNYQNFGPARLPSVHTAILGYCRKLGVPLEVEVNTSRSTFLENDAANGGRPVVQRQVINDARGHVSELLAKCIRQGDLDQDLSPDDRTRMLDFLRHYGPLDAAGAYVGSDRAGYSKLPGAGNDVGVLNKPIDMHTLLDENFWGGILFEEAFDMQATMFQPVGGMDRIPYAFARALGQTVQYNAIVTAIRKSGNGVRIAYTHAGQARQLDADYCLCSLPLNLLRNIPNDFSAPYREVIAACEYAAAYKIAWESRRFWEQDYNIYGGLEYVSQGCNPVWLPSGGMFSERGVLVSGYGWGAFTDLPLDQKFAESRRTIERLHPGHGKELQKPMYVGWGLVPFNQGSWIQAFSSSERGLDAPPGPGYETMIQPDGPIYFIGDYASRLNAWQEGAALSAQRAVQLVSDRVRAQRA